MKPRESLAKLQAQMMQRMELRSARIAGEDPLNVRMYRYLRYQGQIEAMKRFARCSSSQSTLSNFSGPDPMTRKEWAEINQRATAYLRSRGVATDIRGLWR